MEFEKLIEKCGFGLGVVIMWDKLKNQGFLNTLNLNGWYQIFGASSDAEEEIRDTACNMISRLTNTFEEIKSALKFCGNNSKLTKEIAAKLQKIGLTMEKWLELYDRSDSQEILAVIFSQMSKCNDFDEWHKLSYYGDNWYNAHQQLRDLAKRRRKELAKTFEEVHSAYNFDESADRIEATPKLAQLAVTFKEWKSVYYIAPDNSDIWKQALRNLKKQKLSFSECVKNFGDMDYCHSSELKAIYLQRMMKTAKSLEDWLIIYNLAANSKNREGAAFPKEVHQVAFKKMRDLA